MLLDSAASIRLNLSRYHYLSIVNDAFANFFCNNGLSDWLVNIYIILNKINVIPEVQSWKVSLYQYMWRFHRTIFNGPLAPPYPKCVHIENGLATPLTHTSHPMCFVFNVAILLYYTILCMFCYQYVAILSIHYTMYVFNFSRLVTQQA